MAVDRLGRTYPEGEAEFRAWFRSDAACLDYLDWLRWPHGFDCPHCGDTCSWQLADGSHKCQGCKRVVSATAGTIFHGTRTPLTIWFAAAWEMMTDKSGVPALKLQKTLGIGSYQTAWAMLHRYRTVMVRPGRELLQGDVEADETYFGGVKSGGKRGRGSPGKAMVLVAVKMKSPRGLGRCRQGVISDTKSETLKPWLEANVEAGSTLITDGLLSYPSATAASFTHKPVNVKRSGGPAHESLPGCHRVMSLFKRWLLSTTQGGISHEHLQSYLDEFTFRFNRRHARNRGLLFQRLLLQAVQGEPRTYRSLVAVPGSRPGITTGAPAHKRVRPDTLERGYEAFPWRDVEVPWVAPVYSGQ